jgi:CHAD domain-containing protein
LITSTLFQQRFQDVVKKVDQTIGSYLKSASEEKVHDARTAIRRFEAASELLSKSLRSGQIGRYRDSCKKFFKITTEIRDHDIIRDKLVGYDEMKSYDQIFTRIARRRKKLLSRSRKAALKIKSCQPELNADRLRETKLRKKFDKLVSKSNTKIQSLLPLVLSDSKNIEELHLLRKACKRLRYLLEIDSSGEGVPTLIDLLRKWQNLLGRIHDSDITIDYLMRLEERKSVVRVITSERNVRNQAYLEFVNLFVKSSPAGSEVRLEKLSQIFPP